MNIQSNSLQLTEKNHGYFTVAAFQGRCKEGDPKSNFVKVIELMKESVEQAQPFQEMLLTYAIPIESLTGEKSIKKHADMEIQDYLKK